MAVKVCIAKGFKKLSKTERDEKIRDMYATGKFSHRTLGLKVGLSKSHIGRILG